MVNETIIQKDLIVNGLGSFGDRQSGEIGNDLEVFNSTGNVSLGIIANNSSLSALNFGDTDVNAVGELVFNHTTNAFDVKISSISRLNITTAGVTITGDLTVGGTTTTVNSTDLNITDNIILLNKDETGPGGVALGVAGIEIERGDDLNAGWFYNEAEDWWGPTGPSGILGIGGATQKIGNISTIDSTDANNILDINATGAIIIPRGTIAQRPSSPIDGMIRYNSNDNVLEGRINSIWLTLGTFLPGGGFLPLGGGIITGDLSLSNGSQILLDDGTVSEPGLAFVSDTNTGLFRVGADTIGIATGGVIRIQTSTTETDSFVDLDLNGNILFGVSDPILGTHVGDRDYNDARYISIAGDLIMTADILPDSTANLRDIGSPSQTFQAVYATTFNGTATSAQYADVAERYSIDNVRLEPGTVVVFGGKKEITESTLPYNTRVAGVISTKPGMMLNSEAGDDKTHPYIALVGRVPCKVYGVVMKGDLLVASGVPGHAQRAIIDSFEKIGSVFAKAMENHNGGTGVIEVMITHS